MIEITDKMKQDRLKRLAEVESEVDNRISAAAEAGLTKAYFACDKEADVDVYDEIRRKYERAGYIIKPTGYIGGVWQRTEEICW